jgi:hypothetical protein
MRPLDVGHLPRPASRTSIQSRDRPPVASGRFGGVGPHRRWVSPGWRSWTPQKMGLARTTTMYRIIALVEAMRSSRTNRRMSSPVERPVELDLEELFFHLRAKGNEVQSKTYVISAKGAASQADRRSRSRRTDRSDTRAVRTANPVPRNPACHGAEQDAPRARIPGLVSG